MTPTPSSQQVGTALKAEGTALNWTLKAGVHYCFHGQYKLFELKEGLGKWTITMFGNDYIHTVRLDPDQAKAFALARFKEEVAKIICSN
jgi:hypothetical protein